MHVYVQESGDPGLLAIDSEALKNERGIPLHTTPMRERAGGY